MHLFSLARTGSRRLALISMVAMFPIAGLLGGCAENRSNLLPGGTVEEISSNLDRVRELADSGDCLGAIDAAQRVTRQIEGLGTNVDSSLKRSLRDGASRLVLTIQQSCHPSETLTPPAQTTLPELETSPEPTVKPEDSTKPDDTANGAGKAKNNNGGNSGGGNNPGGAGGNTGGNTGGGTGGGNSGGDSGTGTGGVGPPEG